MATPAPMVIWHPGDGRIRVGNRAAAEVAGLALPDLTGRSVFDLLELNPHVEVVAEAIALGAMDSCTLGPRPGSRQPRIVTRAIELDGSREAVTAWSAGAEPVLHPSPLWRQSPIVLGYTDEHRRITAISRDAAAVLDRAAGECLGIALTELMEVDDPAHGWDRHLDLTSVAVANGATVTLLLAPLPEEDPAGYVFAVTPEVEAGADQRFDRVAELEMRLRRIAAEVEAAEVREARTSGPGRLDPSDERLTGLSARQWEILAGLLEGRRVPRIAGDLFLSQSTVRNHLVSLFKRFGVHSQAELIALLRDVPRGTRPPRELRAASGPE